MLKTAASALGAIAMMTVTAATAAPMTVTLTGTVGPSHFVDSTGSLAGVFNSGDTYTITTTIDQDDPAGHSEPGIRTWFGGVAMTLEINGETFTVEDPATHFGSRSSAFADNRDWLLARGVDRTTTAATNPGSATSTIAAVDRFYFEWTFQDNDGQNDILDFSDPRLPTSLDLNDWLKTSVNLVLVDEDGSSYAQIFLNGTFSQAFDTVSVELATTSGGGDTGVPTPGALALLGLGLIGLGARRRTA